MWSGCRPRASACGSYSSPFVRASGRSLCPWRSWRSSRRTTRRGRRSRTGITGLGWATSSEPNQGDMTVDATKQHRFRLSVRSLMIAVAIFALVLALVIGVAQQAVLLHDRRLRAIAAEQLARAAADQAQ